MKVTVKAKEVKNVEVPFDEIPKGIVYEVYDGAVLLKVNADNAVVLKGHKGCDYFDMAHGYKDCPATKILGRLTEIIVEEE